MYSFESFSLLNVAVDLTAKGFQVLPLMLKKDDRHVTGFKVCKNGKELALVYVYYINEFSIENINITTELILALVEIFKKHNLVEYNTDSKAVILEPSIS